VYVSSAFVDSNLPFLFAVVTIVKEVSLAKENGTYRATFPSSQSLSISAANFLLSMQFTGDTGSMQNNSRGLLGEKEIPC